MNLVELQEKTNEELMALAVELNVAENGGTPKRQDLLMRVLHASAEQEGNMLATGILSIVNDGYGFLRQNGNQPGTGDVYVSQSQIRRFGLRTGDQVTGQVRPPKDGERYFGLVSTSSPRYFQRSKSS